MNNNLLKSPIIQYHTGVDQKVPIFANVVKNDSNSAYYDMHYPIEMGIVLEGKTKKVYQNWQQELHPGECWFTGICEPHGTESTAVGSSFLVLVILPELLAELYFQEAEDFQWFAPFAVPPSERPIISKDQRGKILEISLKIKNLIPVITEIDKVELRLLSLLLLLEVMKGWERPPSTSKIIPSHYTKISRTVKMVFKSRKMISVEEAASACGMSRNIFSKHFLKMMGISFANFSLRYRLSCAAGQLIKTGDTVKEIADSWGFTDESHFHHRFKEHYDTTPEKYRRRTTG